MSPDDEAIRAITRATDRWPYAWTSPPPVFNPNHGGFYHYPWQEDGAEVETDELSPADAAVHAAATADLSALQGTTVDTVHIDGSAITPLEETGPVLEAASRTPSATETQRAVAAAHTAVTADTHRAVEELDAQGARTATDRHAQLPDTAEQAPTMDAEAS